jgi:hypothetical protein
VFLAVSLACLVTASVALHRYRRKLSEGHHPCLPRAPPPFERGPGGGARNYGSLEAGHGGGGANGLYPAAGVGLEALPPGLRVVTTPERSDAHLREAASVNRLRGSAYGDINVRDRGEAGVGAASR